MNKLVASVSILGSDILPKVKNTYYNTVHFSIFKPEFSVTSKLFLL